MEESGTRCQLAAPSGSIYSFSEASAGATREVSMETFNSWNLRELGASTVSMRQFFVFIVGGGRGEMSFVEGSAVHLDLSLLIAAWLL